MDGIVTKIILAVMTLTLGWVGSTLLALQVSMATIKADLANLKASVEYGTSSRYTAEQAASDWRTQGMVNQHQAIEIERAEALLRETAARLSERLGAVESAIRNQK